MHHSVDILLATYNGEKYLKEQIDSLISQTHSNWRLIVRDDGSSDSTLEIVYSYKEKYKNIDVIEDDLGNVGVSRNFSLLLERSSSDFVIFCDQDDIWNKNKVELLLKELSMLDLKKPCLAHCDSSIVSQNKSIISNRFIGERGLKSGINEILKEGIVQGASMLINRELIELVSPLPDTDFMHDLYISLVCECFGNRKYIDKSLMSYRQHENNIIGGLKESGFEHLFKKIGNVFKKKQIISNDRFNTVFEFYNRYRLLINEEDEKILVKYLCYVDSKKNRMKRIFSFITSDFTLKKGLHKYLSVFKRTFSILIGRN